MKKEKSVNSFRNVYVREITFGGIPGNNVDEMVKEVFDWFYASQVNKVTLDHLNGAKVTMEWKHETKDDDV